MDKAKTEEPRGSGLTRRRFFNTAATGAAGAAVLAVPAAAQMGTEEIREGEMVRAVLNINGRAHSLMMEPRWTLQHVLRTRLGLTGTKASCERGECGSCTVLIDGVARYSCMTLALEAVGTQVTTVEGLLQGEQLGPVQQAFIEKDGYQCGYCTPGQVMSVEGLLRKKADPTQDDILEALSGNLCRCGAYNHIVSSAVRAAELRKAGR
jgi:xanthine dehydrogenase YagT iron-sulfur-binding subunit